MPKADDKTTETALEAPAVKTVSPSAARDFLLNLGATESQVALVALVAAIALSAAFATWAARRF